MLNDDEYDDEYDDEEYDDEEEDDEEDDDDDYEDGPSKKPLIIVGLLGLAALVCIGLAVLLLNGDDKGDGTADATPAPTASPGADDEVDPLAGLDLGGTGLLDGLDLGLDSGGDKDPGTKPASGETSPKGGGTTNRGSSNGGSSNGGSSNGGSSNGGSPSRGSTNSGSANSRSANSRSSRNDFADPTPEPVARDTPEPVARDTPEPTPEPVADDTPEPTPEPVADDTPEPTPEPVADDTPEPTPEPVAEDTPAPTPEPVAEDTPAPAEPAVPMSYEKDYLASIAGKAGSGSLSTAELNHLKAAPVNDPNYLNAMAIGMANFEAKRDYKSHCEWAKAVLDQGRYKYRPEFTLEMAKCNLRNGQFNEALAQADTTISYQTDMGSSKRGVRITLAYQIKAKCRTALYEADAKKNAGFGNEQLLNHAVAAWTEVVNYAKGVGLPKAVSQAQREIDDLNARRAPTD